MSQFFSIKIPEPCSKDWNTMTPNKKGRFCNACSKTVIDFTKMNTFEIQDFINMNKGKSICGHIKQSQLDSINLQIPIQSINKDLRFHKLFLYALLITMGTSLFSCITDDGNIKKIDSIEVIDTTLKTLDTIAKKSCETNVATIKDTITNKSCGTSKTIDSITQKTCKTKPHKTINTSQLIEGEMILGEIDYPNQEIEEPLIIGDIDYPGDDEPFFNIYTVDAVPEFPNTPNNLSLIEKKNYFQKTITNFITTNFKTDTTVNLGFKGKQKIYASFEIDTDGSINIIAIRSIHPLFEKEADRVLRLLPILKPAYSYGKKVAMLYNLPIIIQFDE